MFPCVLLNPVTAADDGTLTITQIYGKGQKGKIRKAPAVFGKKDGFRFLFVIGELLF